MNKDALFITYQIRATPSDLPARVEALLLEQTVELPRAALRDDFVLDQIVGRVEKTVQTAEGIFEVTLAQPVATTASDPAQFLNVLFGNSSLQPDVVLQDFELPASLAAAFPGPAFGLAGLRALVAAPDRALSSTALKPMGLSAEEMARLCHTFARAGIDLIKDDHGLADHDFCPFEERVKACQQAVDRAAQETGRAVVYAPNLIGSPATVLRQLEFAQKSGARAVMISPMLLGLPFMAELVRDRAEVPILAHPAFGGALRMAPPVMVGKLFRLFGADVSIFPNYGGRFSYTHDECAKIAHHLRDPWHSFRPAFPSPAGGIKVSRIAETLEFYGKDIVLLIGGSLYEAADRLYDQGREFASAVARS